MARLSTLPYHGYAVEFSPYEGSVFAVATAVNYGIAGNGALILYCREPHPWQEVFRFQWPDGIFDVTWSEVNRDTLICGTGDGKLLVVDQKLSQAPAAVLEGHSAEISSVQWSVNGLEQLVLSAAWDKTVRVWDPGVNQCVGVFPDHTSPLVYSAVWSALKPSTFVSVAGDCTLRVWDMQSPTPCVCAIPAHEADVLTCDWSKYNEFLVATGGSDRVIKVQPTSHTVPCLLDHSPGPKGSEIDIRCWDLRNSSAPISIATGHTQAVKKIKFNPHESETIASVSYDFSTRLWTVQGALLQTMLHHSEFTYGVDFNLHQPGEMADCSWDGSIMVYSPHCLVQPLNASSTPDPDR